MAGIDMGGGGGKRRLNQEIPLVPFIDFLLCIVMFLLITAVWSHQSRLEANARMPSDGEPDKKESSKSLRVRMENDHYQVDWLASGSSLPLASFSVPRTGDTHRDVAALTQQVSRSYAEQAGERPPAAAPLLAQVVAGNDADFEQISATFDALAGVRPSPANAPGARAGVAPFRVSLAL